MKWNMGKFIYMVFDNFSQNCLKSWLFEFFPTFLIQTNCMTNIGHELFTVTIKMAEWITIDPEFCAFLLTIVSRICNPKTLNCCFSKTNKKNVSVYCLIFSLLSFPGKTHWVYKDFHLLSPVEKYISKLLK